MERRPKSKIASFVKWLGLAVLSPILIPIIVVAVVLHFAFGLFLYLAIWAVWLPRGKNTLFVYSNSPVWQTYMLEQVLPPIKDRTIVINYSERKRWQKWSLPVRAFHYFGGWREFNPLIVIFRPLRTAKTFRFWQAFKKWKRGDQEQVEALRKEIFRLLSVDFSGRGR